MLSYLVMRTTESSSVTSSVRPGVNAARLRRISDGIVELRDGCAVYDLRDGEDLTQRRSASKVVTTTLAEVAPLSVMQGAAMR